MPASQAPSAIVVGFVGGYVKHDNQAHTEVQLISRLNKLYAAQVHATAFENHHGEDARKAVLKLLDLDHNGSLSAGEKQNARIILYGHSWGASEAIQLARSLGKEGIPVLLTVQVDSVAKNGEDDALIPANVQQAVNFYQPNGIVHGRSRIHAADPEHTRIVGNFRFNYSSAEYRCEDFPWFDRLFMRSHIAIECDPKVWNQVESLIRAKLNPLPESAQAGAP